MRGTDLRARLRAAALLVAIALVGATALAGVIASLHERRRLPGLLQDPLEAGRQARGRGDVYRAAREYRRAAALSSGSYESLLELVQALSSQGDLDGAVQALAAASALRPLDPSLHRGAGFVLFARRRVAEAEGSFRKALASNRVDGRAWLGLGDVLLEQDRYPEAEAALRRALILNPAELSALNSLGIVYALSGRPEQAISAFETVMRHAPDAAIAGNLERARAAAAARAPRP